MSTPLQLAARQLAQPLDAFRALVTRERVQLGRRLAHACYLQYCTMVASRDTVNGALVVATAVTLSVGPVALYYLGPAELHYQNCISLVDKLLATALDIDRELNRLELGPKLPRALCRLGIGVQRRTGTEQGLHTEPSTARR